MLAHPTAVRGFTSLALLLALLGCRSINLNPLGSGERPKMKQAELGSELRSLAGQALDAVAQAAEHIAATSGEPRIRRAATMWKLSASAAYRRLVMSDRPLTTLLEAWVTIERGRQFFATDGAKQLFGDATPMALEVYRSLAESVDELACDVFQEDMYGRVKKQVGEYVREHPAQVGELQGGVPRVGFAVDEESGFEWILSGPTRFLAFATGVDDTAKAIDRGAQAAERFTLLAGELPREIRWQSELMLHDLDGVQALTTAMERIGEVSASVDAIAETAEGLPARLQAELSETLDEIDAKQENLRGTIGEAKALVTEVQAAMREATPLVDAAERAMAGLEAAGKAWEPTFRELRLLVGGGEEAGKAPESPPDPNAPAVHPFDIREYDQAVATLGGTAKELRATIAEARATLGSDDVPRAIRQVSERTIDFADHVFWRAVQFLGVLLGALLLYRFVQKRWM